MTARTDRPLIVIGSGPGIGTHVARLFANQRFNKIALVSRSANNLARDQREVMASLPGKLTVKTYTADATESEKLVAVLNQIEEDLGSPEFVFYNAAEIIPNELLGTEEKELIYGFKTTCTGLYAASKWAIPRLEQLSKSDVNARPSLLVTSSFLPKDPIPQLFCLSMMKAAQRNMVQSLYKVHGKDIHIGMVSVGGAVEPTAETLNPTNIAARTWELFDQSPENRAFEIEVV